jgi:hypothetical protein
MSLAILEVADLAAAIALAKAIGADARYARDGVALPRCDHARWRLRGGALARHRYEVASDRGVVPPCPCEARDRPSTRCAHATWQAASVIALPDGTVLVQAEEAAVTGRPEPRRLLTEDERDASEERWTLRAERRDAGDR